MKLLYTLNAYLLGPCLPPLLLAAGLFFAVRLSFFFLRHPLRTLGRLFGRDRGRGSFRALCVALAGTLGVGNITGVAVALTLGGAGAVLWMVAGGVLSAVLKYAEIVLTVDGRVGESRGALDYISPSLGQRWGLLFAALAVLLSLTMGSLLQGTLITEATVSLLPVRPLSVGLLLTAVTLLLFLGGRRAVERLSAILMPILTLLYTAAAVFIIFVNITSLPVVLSRILREAFSLRSVGGGLGGIGALQAMRAGIQKGLFSNEAGAGTAPFAHGNAVGVPPARQGIFGIAEVFIDTVVMCPLTAIAILTALDPLPSVSGTALVAAAFRATFGEAGGWLLTLSIIAFSYATVACWVSYGRCALTQLTDSPLLLFCYPLLFSFLLTGGALLGESDAFLLCDLALGAMTLINIPALLKNATRVRDLSKEYGLL